MKLSNKSTRGGLIDASFGVSTILVTIVVKSDWLFTIIHEFNNFVEILECYNGHDRFENLVLHYLRIEVGVNNNCRLDVLSFVVELLSSVYNLSSRSFNAPLHPLEVIGRK